MSAKALNQDAGRDCKPSEASLQFRNCVQLAICNRSKENLHGHLLLIFYSSLIFPFRDF